MHLSHPHSSGRKQDVNTTEDAAEGTYATHLSTPTDPVDITGLFVRETEEFKLPFFYIYETKSAVFGSYV